MEKPKLFDRVRAATRVRHLSLRTERAYSDWIRRYILFHRKRHPEEMGTEEIRQFQRGGLKSWGGGRGRPGGKRVVPLKKG
jgi:hypothetical protein